MKKIICMLLIIFIFCFVFDFGTVFAATDEYYEIKSDEIYLYTRSIDANDVVNYNRAFLLPISYYVKVVDNPEGSLGSNYLKVSYNGITGWIEKSSVNATVTDISDPYFQIADLSVSSSVNLYKDYSTSSQTVQSLQTNSSPTFISYIKNGNSTWYYVKTAENNYGYIQSEYTNHPTLPFTRHDNGEDNSGGTVPINKPIVEFFNNMDNNLLNWILTILILIPTVTFCILIFKRKSSSSGIKIVSKEPPAPPENTDENDSQIYVRK